MPQDGERLLLVSKELPTSEVYPVTISFDPTGRSVVVCGESKFVVFTAIAWRHKSYGTADEYVWGSDKLCVLPRPLFFFVPLFRFSGAAC